MSFNFKEESNTPKTHKFFANLPDVDLEAAEKVVRSAVVHVIANALVLLF